MENTHITVDNNDNGTVRTLGMILAVLAGVIVLLTLTGWLTKGYFTEGVVDTQAIPEYQL
jgi:hypothetical protein